MFCEIKTSMLLSIINKIPFDKEVRNIILDVKKVNNGFYSGGILNIKYCGFSTEVSCNCIEEGVSFVNLQSLRMALLRVCDYDFIELHYTNIFYITCNNPVLGSFSINIQNPCNSFDCCGNSLNEVELLDVLHSYKNQRILFYDPYHSKKIIPIGIAKLMSFFHSLGNYNYTFTNEYIDGDYDLLCISSVFTYNATKVFDFIERFFNRNEKATILVGGGFAAMMPNKVLKTYSDVKIFKGYSKVLDSFIPNYDYDFKQKEPWDTYAHVFTTRGCENNCKYCAVGKVEGSFTISDSWEKQIKESCKQNIVIHDNNIAAFPEQHLVNVVNALKTVNIDEVSFQGGFDCRLVTKDFINIIKQLKFSRFGVRLAFDRIEDDSVFQQATQEFLNAGFTKKQMLIYVLFNFTDTPKEAEYRAQEVRKLGLRVYPQLFVPLNKLSRRNPYVGKNWTLNLARGWNFFYSKELYLQMTFEAYLNGKALKFNFTEKDKEAWYGTK